MRQSTDSQNSRKESFQTEHQAETREYSSTLIETESASKSNSC